MNLTTEQIYCILALSAFFLASLGCILGTLALIKSLAIEASTHTVQYMPIDTAIDQENEAFLKKQGESRGNSWATSDASIKTQMELHKEDVDNIMPEFSTSDEDTEVLSF